MRNKIILLMLALMGLAGKGFGQANINIPHPPQIDTNSNNKVKTEIITPGLNLPHYQNDPIAPYVPEMPYSPVTPADIFNDVDATPVDISTLSILDTNKNIPSAPDTIGLRRPNVINKIDTTNKIKNPDTTINPTPY